MVSSLLCSKHMQTAAKKVYSKEPMDVRLPNDGHKSTQNSEITLVTREFQIGEDQVSGEVN